MSSSDAVFGWTFLRDRRSRILFILACCLTTSRGENLFKPGKQYTYSYYAESNSGVLFPAKAASSFGIKGTLAIRAQEETTTLQLNSLRTFVWNGKYPTSEENLHASDQTQELSKPFQVKYTAGLIANFSVGTEAIWATNIKRSIAGILQLDLAKLENQVAFHAIENNHYGQCTIEYVVAPETNEERSIRKFYDPRTCVGHPHWTWTNVPRIQCPNDDENPIIKSSERLYKVRRSGNDSTLIFVNATGGIYIQPFQSLGEAHFLFIRQNLELIAVEDIKDHGPEIKFVDSALQHELPDGDLTQGRSTHKKEDIFTSISILLDRLSQRLENPGLDTEINNLHNTTISVLLHYLEMLDQTDLKTTYDRMAGTSYKEETIRNMFLEILPQVGTRHAALFVLDLIMHKKVSDITAMQLLTYLPFHIRKPDIKLLASLQTLVNMPEKISIEVRNTGILTFGTLIYKTCLSYCPYETLDDYVRLYLDKFTETPDYDKKMVWLEGLSNIQLGRVVEFLEPIASGNSVESRHLRVLAAWASLPTAPLRPDVIYPVYWPIFVNRTENLELRIAALTLLIVSKPSANRMISLYWYMHDEPDRHLYNFFYTTLKSLERTNFPCYKHIGGIAAQFTRVLRMPPAKESLVTGNYIFDYQDTKRHFGAMVQSLIIANPRTNIPEVAYITLNSHGSGTNLNHISLYVKAEGLVNSLSSYIETPTRVEDILKNFKINERPSGEVHLEIIARVQQKAVFCLHFNQSSIEKGIKYLTSLPASTYQLYQNMEFHVNQQRINIPLVMESLQVTDLGTNVRVAATATSLFSMRGNFTHQANGRSNHVIIRTAIHGREVVETYNPLIDVWHAAERAQSIHGYMPINVTIGLEDKFFLLYNTPAEYLRTGVTANVRTATSIRGPKAQKKLQAICPECSILYTVRKFHGDDLKDIILFEAVVPELGGQLRVKVSGCDGYVDQENYLSDVFSSHRSNQQSWPAVRVPLLIIHFLDFFTYVPPKGSCGVSVYVEPTSLRPSEVKMEYVKSGKYHMFSLVRRQFGSLQVLQQWNLVAVYESASWISDTLKIKASKTSPGEKVVKVCIEGERETPWAWDFLSTKPSDPASVKLSVIWGLADSAKGKCVGSSIMFNLVGEVTQKQVEDAKRNTWPYSQCRADSNGKNFVPYTDACYEASRELSTLRKYQMFVRTENLPAKLQNVIWRFRALYDLMGGNSSHSDTNQFVIGATLPKDSGTALIQVNRDKLSVGFDENIIDMMLVRTRLHKFLDNSLLRSTFGVCALTRTFATSSENVSFPLTAGREFLVLAQCYEKNPRFALRATSTASGVTLISDDDSGSLTIVPDKHGGTVYNFTEKYTFKRDFEWNTINAKRIRLDDKSIHLFYSDHLVFVHVTEEQILILFPNYMKELSCGVCTVDSVDEAKLYEKII